MSILFSAVAQGTTVLARHAICLGNFAEVTERALVQIKATVADQGTFQDGAYTYHYLRSPHFLYFGIAEPTGPPGDVFNLLRTLQSQFERTFSGSRNPIPYAMHAEFSPILAREMKRANDRLTDTIGEADDSLSRARREVQSVKEVLESNIDLVVQRGEHMALLVDKTEHLSSDSVNFRQRSRQIQRRMWWENIRMKIILGVVAILVLYMILAASCGGAALPKCV